MISVTSIIVLLTLLAIYWYWHTFSRCKEQATYQAKKACEQHDLQFLDGTVELKKSNLMRDRKTGRIVIFRIFTFDYFDGSTRYRGEVEIVGQELIALQLTRKQLKKSANEVNNVIPFPTRNKD